MEAKWTEAVADEEQLRRVFLQFDTNRDGKISLSELGEVMKSMGSNHTPKELQRAMEDIDTDKDGFIDFAEFTLLCHSSSAPSELRDAFDLYDQNKDGLISAVELHLVLNRLGMNCSVEECGNMIKNLDSDGDGSVNFQEFEKMMATRVSSN